MSTPTTTKPSSFASRKKSYGAVHAALTIHSREAVNVLGQRNVEDTSYQEIFAHLADELETARDDMISANTAHLHQLALIVDLKQRRDALTDTLLDRFLKTRHTFEALYGSEKRFPLLAISGKTPTAPTALIVQVRDSVSFLENPRVVTSAHGMPGIELDLPIIAGQLSADADALDRTLAEVNEAEKQADGTRQAKNEAIRAYDRKFLRVARVAESLFHFAGMHELADRVRPSTRRPGRRLADENGEADARTVEAQADAPGEPDAPDTQAPEAETDTASESADVSSTGADSFQSTRALDRRPQNEDVEPVALLRPVADPPNDVGFVLPEVLVDESAGRGGWNALGCLHRPRRAPLPGALDATVSGPLGRPRSS